MGEMSCKMSMLMDFDSPINVCVVFRSWHIKTQTHVFFTLLALVALSASFEYLRWRIRAIDTMLAIQLASSSSRSSRPLLDEQQEEEPAAASSSSSSMNAGPRSTSEHHRRSSTGISLAVGGQSLPSFHRHQQHSRNLSREEVPAPSNVIVSSLFTSPRTLRVSRWVQLVRVGLYGLNVAAGAFLMLVLMTYNIWLIGATVVGAMLGHFFFSRELGLASDAGPAGSSSSPYVAIPGVDADKGLSCH
ncbi:copper transpport protein [Tilletia horrida]|uniref:Copper transport protein n=1 Tax=Tilletia horrida TaxID=155126 RepID=A0AAN6GUV8_9BASI|nr:copper transpport protein [Tilletia horrida]